MKRIVLSQLMLFFISTIYVWGQHIHPSSSVSSPRSAIIAGEKALGQKKYALADHYADIALEDDSTAKRAAEIKIQSMGGMMKTKQDSAKYIIALLELHSKDRNNPIFFSLLMKYFSWPGREKEMRLFAQDELRADSSNFKAWLLKGETYMREQAWDCAIHDFQKAIDLDSTLTEAIYNIGICYSSKAIALKEALEKGDSADLERELSKDEVDSIKQVFMRSKEYLEKVSAMDPEYKVVDWRKALYQVYYVLEDKRATDVKKLLRRHGKLTKRGRRRT